MLRVRVLHGVPVFLWGHVRAVYGSSPLSCRRESPDSRVRIPLAPPELMDDCRRGLPALPRKQMVQQWAQRFESSIIRQFFASLAQWIAQRFPKPRVRRSIRLRGTISSIFLSGVKVHIYTEYTDHLLSFLWNIIKLPAVNTHIWISLLI